MFLSVVRHYPSRLSSFSPSRPVLNRRPEPFAVSCATKKGRPCPGRRSEWSRSPGSGINATGDERDTSGSFVIVVRTSLQLSSTSRSARQASETYGEPVSRRGRPDCFAGRCAARRARARGCRGRRAVGVVAVDTNRSVVDAVIPPAHRIAATQRPQLPRAGAAGAGQRAGAELRPDEVQYGHRSRRPASSAAAATSRWTARTTTTMSSADHCRTSTQEAVQEFQIATNRFTAETGRSASSVDQRRHQVRQRPAARLGVALPARLRAGRGCRRPTTAASATIRRSIASSLSLPRRAARRAVRRSGLAPSSTATRTAACWLATRDLADAHDRPQRLRRRRSRTCSARPGSTGGSAAPTRRHVPLRRPTSRRHGREHARSRDWIGVATPVEPQPLPVGHRHLDAHVVTDARQHDICIVQHIR